MSSLYDDFENDINFAIYEEKLAICALRLAVRSGLCKKVAYSKDVKSKPVTSYFTKIRRSGQTSYQDEDASSEIEVAGEVHRQDDPQLLLRTSSEAASCSSSTTVETTCEFDIGLYHPASRPDGQTKYDYLTRHWKPPQGTASFRYFAF